MKQTAYHTQYSTINVSCETCHGPGKLHIDYINGADYKKGNKTTGFIGGSWKKHRSIGHRSIPARPVMRG